MRSRKGANAYSLSYMVGGFVVVLTVVVIVALIVRGGFLTKTGQSNDLGDVDDVVGAMKNKCDDAVAGSASVTSIGVDADFEQIDYIDMTGSDTSYTLEVGLQDGNSETYDLTGCRYEFEKEDAGSWEGAWHFDVSYVQNSENPAVINTVATKK